MITIWSGGQTGVDRGALDAALSLGVPIGGWAPSGWRAEDGVIPERYRVHMREHPSADYRLRTELNVRHTHGTLIISPWPITGGTGLTRKLAKKEPRPWFWIDSAKIENGDMPLVLEWIARHNISKLNVAGPRESKIPGIQAVTEGFMVAVLERLIEAEKGQSK